MNLQRLLIIGLVLLGFILSFVASPIVVWGGMTVAFFGFLLIGYPQVLLFIYWAWASVMLLVTKVVGGPFKFLDELLVLATIVIFLGSKILKRDTTKCEKDMQLVVTAMYVIMVISVMLNRASPVNFLNVFVSYYTFPFVMFLAYRYRSEKGFSIFINWSFLFFLLQLVLNMGWKLRVNPLPNEHAMVGNYLDMFHGSIGGANWVAYLSISFFFLWISIIRTWPGTSWRRIAILLFPLGLIQFRFCYTNHAYLYMLPCIAIYIAVISRKISVMFKWLTIFSIIGIGTIGIQSFSGGASGKYVEQESLSQQLSGQNLQKRWDKFLTAPKMQLVETVTKSWITSHPQRWLIGMGPGNGTSAVGMTRVSPGAYELLAPFYLTTSGNEELLGNSIMQSTYSGLVSIWSETGIVGYIVFLYLHLYVLLRIIKLLWNEAYSSRNQRILAETFVPTMVLYLISSLLLDTLHMDFWLVPIWVMAGFVWTPLKADNVASEL